MTDDRNSFYLTPGIWNYKNEDLIYGSANTRNEYDRNLKNYTNTVIIKFQGKKSNFAHSNINNYNTRHDTNIFQRNLLLEYKNIKSYNVLRIQQNLFKYVDESIINKKRFHSIPKLDNLPEMNSYNDYDEIGLNYCSQSCQQITAKPEFVNNIVSDFSNIQGSYHCSNPFSKSCSWKVYRCQFNTQEESCCCSCNSDAMFEVMKSLYDCYKKKNCDNCNCILCGHLPREERRLGKLRKSGVGLASVAVGEKYKGAIAPEKALLPTVKATAPPKADVRVPSEKLRKAKAAGLLTPLEGKRPEQKEKILRGLAMQGIPLPEPKTASEKKLMDRVRAVVGLPPEPKTPSAKEKYNKAMAAGLISPLEGKSAAKKEDILRGQAKMGLPLPEGRTASEKALIAKVRATAPPEAEVEVPSEQLRKAKAAGVLTPLEGKRPEEKEKFLRGLAMQGIPLPEAKTASEKNLIDKVRADIGLPPEPTTPSAKEKYNKAMAAGLITPLQGKSVAKKEDILRGQAKIGLALPEGRTPSEKALIAKFRATAPPEAEARVPSEKLRKAKAAGLLMPLGDKKPEEKEKILRGLAMQGIPLPEANTESEKKLLDRVRTDLGLPPEPNTPSAKKKYNKAIAAGLITPLEGKSAAKKEEILREQAKMGISLPEGRTASEKALINTIKTSAPLLVAPPPSKRVQVSRPALHSENIIKLDKKTAKLIKEKKGPSDECICDLLTESPESKREPLDIKLIRRPTKKEIPTYKSPSEKLRQAKAAGLMTPLEGKRPEQKEKILRGLAMHGIPLPEPKTVSEKKLMDRVRADVGLPPEPKTPSAREKYNSAMASGLITPLEGKSAAKKEEILREQAKMGLPFPEGRTPSEKALIAKVRATAPPEAKVRVPSEKLRKAKAAGLLTPLEGKRPEQKEKILRGLAMQGVPLPEAKTASEKKLMDRVRADVGLPPEPKTPSAKVKYNKAMAAGLITPLEGKSVTRKEEILRGQAKIGLPLPEGRTPSEKAFIAKVRATAPPEAEVRVPSEKLRKAEAAGLLTPLEGKRPEQKEKILRGLAMHGIPLPEPKTASEKKLMDRVRADVGLPPEPKTPSAREKYNSALASGLITPLEGKSAAKKEEILREQAKMGLPLPEGRTPSEKALIAKVRATAPPEAKVRVPSEKLRKAKAAGLLTPLEGKKPEQKEKFLRGLAMQGIPLPEPKTASEKKLIDRVRADVGLPPEPKTPSAKEKYNKAMAAGLITPLEGKSAAKKEEILREQAKMGLSFPEGRTPSEKALIAKVRATAPPEAKVRVPSEKLRKAKAAGLLTPLEGKRPEQKEKILRGLAMQGIPLPEPKTTSEMKLMDKVRADVGLPPKPKTPSAKEKYNRAMASGLITPLEGKSAAKKEEILREQAKMGLPLPEGRTPSEKALIAKVRATAPPEAMVRVPSEKLRRAKAAGLLTPLEGKRPEQKEKILRGLAMQGIPLPEPKTVSEKKLIDRVRADVGLPPEPKTPSAKEKYNRAMAAGLITPLERKSAAKKEDLLRGQAKMGLPLPEGRTPSEKALIAKIKGIAPSLVESPELIKRVKGRQALSQEKLKKLDKKTAKVMKEKKGPSDECICDLLTPVAKHPLIKTAKEPTKQDFPPYKIASEKMLRAKAAGLLTPLEGKRPEQKEKILRGLAMQGIPLPEPKTTSEKKLMDRVRADVGLPPEPKTPSAKEKYNRAMASGLITPLEGKSAAKKEEILREQAKVGLPLPEGRTPSEKALIAKVRATAPPEAKLRVPSEKLRKAKAAGLLTPLEGKRPEQKEKMLRGLAMQGIPLPEPKTASEKKLMDRVRADVGLPPEPKSPSAKEKYNRAMAAGLITPIEGKSAAKKEEILREQAKMGLPLPEGRTPSEKALIAKVRATVPLEAKLRVPSGKLRKAKAAGLLTPLEGKRPEQKEKILRGLAMQGIPLPEPKTASEKKLIDRVRADVGLPSEPKTPSAKEKYNMAMAAGLITPLEGKSAAKKEEILREQAKMGLPLPEGRTPSEKALIAKVRTTAPPEAKVRLPSENLRKAKAAGLLTPLEGKRPEQKEKILRGLALHGIPLPEPQTASEKKLIDRVRADVGLPPEPKTPSAKEKYNMAMAAGLITPLEGKSAAKKEEILREQAKMGLPLPEGRTPSEKALMAKVRATAPPEAKVRVPSEKLRKAKAAGLLTPLEGKKPEEKEKILRGLAMQGIPLPEPKTASEKKLIDRVRADVGLPSEPKTPSAKEKYNRAVAGGLITPLEGISAAKKEEILREQAKMGLPLPEGRTLSEKALIAKIKATVPLEAESLPQIKPLTGRPALVPEKLRKLDKKTAKIIKEKKGPSDECICDLLTLETERETLGISVSKPPLKTIIPTHKISSEKVRKAQAEGLLTPLEGKKPEEKERILKQLALKGIPLPEAKSASEKKIIDKVRTEVGLPPVPKEPSAKKKYEKALADGIITPLEGKSTARKKEILHSQAKRGLSLPQGRTPSEKAIIAKVKATLSSEKEISLKTDYGLPIKATTPSEKELVKTAKAEGLLTPLKGKTSMQKEKILRGLAEAGLPMPEGATPSEKALVQKVRTMVGLPPEPTPSEKKGKIKKKSKKVGIIPVHKSAKGVGVAKSKGGITEEFQDIIKTTTCDRGCGCDKKKIRFKHSYVKIRVTSPDISSLCPCPDECVPGVKGGVFTDNEGIKVTIGRITDIPSYTPRKITKLCRKIKMYGPFSDSHLTVSSTNKNYDIDYYSPSYIYSSDIISKQQQKKSGLQLKTYANELSNFELNNKIIFIKTFGDRYENSRTSSSVSSGKIYKSDTSISSNLDSVDLMKTDSSISLNTSSRSYSIISFSLTETASYSQHCVQDCLRPNKYYKIKKQNSCNTYFNPKDLVFGIVNYDLTTNYSSSKILTSSKEKYNGDFMILQTDPYKANYSQFLGLPNRNLPVMFVNDCHGDAEIFETIYELILKNILNYSSSLVIMMPTLSEECDGSYSLESLDSNDYVQVSENHTNRIHKLNGLHNSYQTSKGFRLVTKGKQLENDLTLVEVFNRSNNENGNHKIHEKCDKYCQVCQNIKKYQIISTDTTQDRPCCCPAKENGTKYKRLENYISEIVTPMILTEAVAKEINHEAHMHLNENKSFSHMSFDQLHLCNQKPGRLCNVPPCIGHTECRHQPTSISKDCCMNDVNLMKPRSCKMTGQFIERITKEMTSIGCGKSEEDLRGKLAKPLRAAIKLPCESVNSTKRSCITCGIPQVQDDESFSCLCKGKKRKMKWNNTCPCEPHKIPSQIDAIKHQSTDKSGAFSNVGCRYKAIGGNKKNKNAICECEELEPQFKFDARDWIDETQIRKMKSDLTQTVSGFKLNIPRKKPESDKSFEEILKHFAENTEQNNLFTYEAKACSCNEKSLIKQYPSVDCECPYEAPQADEESPFAEEPFQGIKFHIGGKGSDSKGLSGILCFQLLQEVTLPNSNFRL